MFIESRRVKISLTQEEYDFSASIAKQRGAKESRFGAMTYGNKRGGIEAHMLGVIPEMAVAKLLGCEIDTEVFDSHGDNGIDLQSKRHGKIGVKNTTYKNDPFLRVEAEHFHDNIDIYILCSYDMNPHNVVNLIGYAKKEEVIEAEKRVFVDGGPLNYVLEEQDLHPISDLTNFS
jgi:hypothetical protein